MSKLLSVFVVVLLFCFAGLTAAEALGEKGLRPLVKREERATIVETEYGKITGARVSDGTNGTYHLQFFTLEPNSLFLPVLLHADMIFYVKTGTGTISWTDEEEDRMRHSNLKRGDVYRLRMGSVFFVQSSLEPERQKLRIHAIFATSNDDLREPATGPYSSIRDMVLGFDKNVLKAAFRVSEDVIRAIISEEKPPAIVHVEAMKETTLWEKKVQFVTDLIERGGYSLLDVTNKKKKRSKLYNILNEDPDFENCNGWSSTVTGKKLAGLRGSNVGIFMVNLTTGSMMGPHWNPMATEIAVVLQGEGMVRVVCPSIKSAAGCQNMRFQVAEGDVFAVPRFHPMAQMAFNNGTFVFMGFTTSAKKNHPQYLAGKASVLRALNKDIVATSFNVTNTTIDQLLAQQGESVILECISCAEQEFRVMEEEIEREKEEARKREEEEARKEEEERRREEEEARRKEEEQAKKEEEERRKREEEEARQREEEAEAERKREEEEARKREEEEARQREEAAAREREREEEEAREREEEAARQREREEEEAREREEEAARQREREEEEAQQREEEEARQREEEEARQREEEAARQREREEEEARQREEEEARQREEEAARQREREEEEARQREEEQAREEERRRQEAAETEAEAARREEEERQRQQEGGGEGEGPQEETKPGQEWERSMDKKWGRRVLKRLTI